MIMNQTNTPFQEYEVKDYEKKRYRGLDQRLVHKREMRLLNKILRGLPAPRGMALDLPCGYGRFSSLLSEQGYIPVSCDYSFEMVRRARTKHQRLQGGAGLGAVVDAKQALPFREESFDLVFCLRFFHHARVAADRDLILTEFASVSRGYAVCSFYQKLKLHEWQRRLRKKLGKSRAPIKMISRREFLESAGRAGWMPVGIYPLFRGLHAQHIVLLRRSKAEFKS